MSYASFFLLQKTAPCQYAIQLDSDHELFKVHFANFPILPGSCTSNIIRTAAENEIGGPLTISHITQMKFVKPIFPNETVYNLSLVISPKENEWSVKAQISSHEQVHCKAQLTLTQKEK